MEMKESKLGNLINTVGNLHSEIWGEFMKGNNPGVCDIINLADKLPKLRNILICPVCETLLSHESVIPKSNCTHAICKDCQSSDLSSICPSDIPCCEYEDNKCLTLFVKSYTLFCHTILSNKKYHDLIELAADEDPKFEGLDFIEILKEGAFKEMSFKQQMNISSTTTPVNNNNTTNTSTSTSTSIHDENEIIPSTIYPEYQFDCENESNSTTNENGQDLLETPTFTTNYEGGEKLSPVFCKIEPLTIATYEDEQHDEFASQGEILVTSNVQQTQGFSPSLKDPLLLSTIHTRQPRIYSKAPSTLKWPDPNKILEFASGNIDMSQTDFGKIVVERNSSTPPSKIVGSVVRAVDGSLKKLKVRLPKQPPPPKIRRGCRCGNAAAAPGKLTCCGQRCPCYVENKACFDCKCKGCRNPHLSDGKKLLQGINAVIDTKTNTTVQLPMPGRSDLYSNFDHLSSGHASFYPVGAVAKYGNYSVQLPIINVATMVQPIKTEPTSTYLNNGVDF